jgi:hypothetical protein
MLFEAYYHHIPRRSIVPSRGQADNGAVAGKLRVGPSETVHSLLPGSISRVC